MPNDKPKHSIHSPKIVAEKLQSLIDNDHNLPICHCASCGGIEVGTGIHVPHGIPLTKHLYDIKKHPKEEKYAHPMTAEIQPYVRSLIENDYSLSAAEKEELLNEVNNPT